MCNCSDKQTNKERKKTLKINRVLFVRNIEENKKFISTKFSKKMRALIVFVTIFIFCFDKNGQADEDVNLHLTESQIVMDSLSPYDRPNFVAYHIALALNKRDRHDVVFKPVLETIPFEKRQEFAKIHTPTNFSINLLDWTESELVKLENNNINNWKLLVGRYNTAEVKNICFPSGCVDPNDAGYLCCPF